MRQFLAVAILSLLAAGSTSGALPDEDLACIDSHLMYRPSQQEAVATYCHVHGAKLHSGCTLKELNVPFATSRGYLIASILYFPQAHTYEPRLGRGYVSFALSDEVQVRYCMICREVALAWAARNSEHPNRNLWADFALLENLSRVACGNGHFGPTRGF